MTVVSSGERAVPGIDHVLLTRFNLPTGGFEARIRANESWLARRWELFETYCAPSVTAQTSSAFTWLIYFDPESPDWLVNAIEPYVARGLFQPVFRAEVPTAALLEDIRAVSRHPEGMLLTTNLDNDDAIATDFLQRVRDAVDFTDRRALYVQNGLVKSAHAVYRRHDPHNAFCSVAAPWTRPSTSWDQWHILLGQSMPVVGIGGAPGWLQVIHGENVSNRVRGRLTSPRSHRAAFPRMLDDIAEPEPARLLADRALIAPARRLRDIGRGALRRVAIALLGQDGMQQVKARILR